MLGSAKGPLANLTPLRVIILGIVLVVIIILVVGTVSQSSAPDPIFGGLQTQPFIVLAILALFAGLMSFASPCTLPILPAYFAFAFQSDRKHIAVNTMVFMLGLASVFAIMGAGASLVGQALRQNQALILLIGGAFIMIFGVMSILGRGFTGVQAQGHPEQNRSVGGSLLFGMTFAVGWSSCVGPILGTVLTMAGTTGSVIRGMMLLFIYALGLGLPLIIVSTFFGRADRNGLFWRTLRGKGWNVTVRPIIIGLLWVFAIWRILVAVVQYAFANFDYFTGQEFTTGHEIGLLVLTLIGVALWILSSPSHREKVPLHLHSTQMVSGALFIVLGILFLNGSLATFNSYVPPELAIWFAGLEDQLIEIFSP